MAEVHDEIEVIDDDIPEIVQSFSTGSHQQQFVFVPPTSTTTIEKKRKAQELKEQRKKQKAASSEEGSTLPDNKEGGTSLEHVIKITAYIDVIITQPAAAGRKKGSVSECLQRGPFIFYNNTGFIAFQTMVAKTLPCPPSSLNWPQIKWKFDIPANSRAKNLSDNIGFEAMIACTLERKKNFVIRIITPPPAKPEIPWATGEDDHIPEDKDLFDSIESIVKGHSTDLPRNQIAAIKENITPIVEQLKTEYPIGKCQLFPDRRVYQDGNRYWELDGLRLDIWATAIARGNANLKAPPPSKHFSDDKKLRLPPTPTSAAPPASASASASLTDPMALLQQLVQQNAAMMMFASSFNPLALASSIGVGVAPFASTTALGSSASVPSVSATPNSATSSPSNVLKLPRSISVEEFSVHYNISDSDRLKLVTLEVHLGDHAVEKLEPEYWKEVGFSKLGWDRFLAAHRQFIMDVRNGIWG